MNKTLHLHGLSALLALSMLTPLHTARANGAPLPDCSVDEKGRSDFFQAFSEGLAAVRVPVAGQRDGRWGFIDTRGSMVIKPGYDQVRPFAHGLAAALRNGKWGYIDTQGRWVIEPLYDQASSFGDHGHALVTQGGALWRIDRTGQTQGVVPASQHAVLHDPVDVAGQRWSVSLEPPEQLWDLQGGRVMPLPEGLSNIGTPQDGLVPAEKRLPSGAQYWGLLNLQGRWITPPQRLQSTDRPLHDQGLVARYTKGGWQFVNLQGEAQHTGTLHEVRLMRQGSWVVAPEEGRLELWDTKARRVMDLPPGLALYSPDTVGDSVVIKTGEHVALIAPQGRAWHWPIQGRDVHTAQNLLWLLRDEHNAPSSPQGPNEIIRPDGQAFLDEAVRARLNDYLVMPMNPETSRYVEPEAKPIALAMLTPLDGVSPPAILTVDGHIASQATWLHIRPRHDSADPWVVQTREGQFGAIDGQGHWRVPPVWQGLDDFHHGLSMGRRADVADGRRQVLLDSDAHLLDTPPEVSQACTRWIGAVLYCVNDQGTQLAHYLWLPRRQQQVAMAALKQVVKAEYGFYRVQQGELWGLMDSQGAWRIPPRLAQGMDLRQLDADVGLETLQETDTRSGKRFRLISLVDGRPLTAPHLREPERMAAGRYRVHTEHEGSRLINARGDTVLQQAWPSGHAQTDGQWATVLTDDIWGVMDLQGQWHVPPRYRNLSGPFGPAQWLSVQTHGGDTLLVNAEGQPVAGDPALLEAQPTPGSPDKAPALRLVQRGSRQAYVNAQGQAVITAEVQCHTLILRQAQGRPTWPPQSMGCSKDKQQKARP